MLLVQPQCMPLLPLLFLLPLLLLIANLKDSNATPTSQWYKDQLDEWAQVKAVRSSIAEWQKRSTRSRHKRSEKSICYGDLGCFEDTGPFGYLDMLPSHPHEINTKFYVHSAKYRSDKPFLEFYFHEIFPNINETSQANSIDAQKHRNFSEKIYEKFGKSTFNSVRVIAHGFGSACPHVWVQELQSALMAVEDCLVICVDWENGATLPNYVRAATNTRLVGRQIAMVLKDLTERNVLEMSKVHIIGFSLGAHVAGFAGAILPGLRRITGLDPAGPLFESQHPKVRLDDTDADYVDVIHSNGQNLVLGGLGAFQPMGSVDFYPNGGRGQAGCSNLFLGAVTDIIWAPPASVEGRSLCNHRRAYKFFIDSVAPNCLFPAFPCDTYEDFMKGDCFSCESNNIDSANGSACGNMGYYADKSSGKGQLYLKTREEEPFCAHQYKIEVYSSLHDLPLRTLGRIDVTLESDNGLFENFVITEKDDTELFAGEVLSEVIVPHPALGFPTNVSILYTEYKGWLTRGLTTWSINKFVLSDSFGQTFSICKHIILESQSAVSLSLEPGNCDIKDETYDESLDNSDENDIGTSASSGSDSAASDDNWAPVILKDRTDVKKNISPLAVVPIKPKRESRDKTQMEDRTYKRSSDKRSYELPQDDGAKNASKSSENSLMGQIIPARIYAVFEKAERYARQTILPYLTGQFPSFFRSTDTRDNSTNAIIETDRYIAGTYLIEKPVNQSPVAQQLTFKKGRRSEDYLQSFMNISSIKEIFSFSTAKPNDLAVRVELPTFLPTQIPPTTTTRTPRKAVYLKGVPR